nr:uncharacterized mitochondrial protein AtMg00810-like [Tanacetum cinerariifolium]
MSTPTFAKTHNLIANLEKPTETKVKTVNDEVRIQAQVRIQALVDGKRVNIKESSIRRTLRLDDAEEYDEDFAPVARIEAIRIFLAFASFMGFIVYQMDVKSTFLYSTINEEVYVTQPPGFVDPKYPKKKRTHLQDSVYKEGQEGYHADISKAKLGLWYPRESAFDLKAYSDSDYAGANLDRKSTTGGCQFLGRRLISWQCKKQIIVATSTTEAEYIAATSCCGLILWIQN